MTNPLQSSPCHRRRWFQFGLRGLLIVMTIFVFWLGSNANRAHQQRVAVARVLKLGGFVQYEYQAYRDSQGRFISDSSETSSYPDWLLRLLGPDHLHNVTLVGLENSNVADEDLRLFSKVSSIEILDLSGTNVSSDGLRHIKSLPKLRFLSLARTNVDDRGVEQLRFHTRLNMLALDGTKITDEGLRYLESMTDLENWLGLAHTQVSDAGLVHLQCLKKLRTLNLIGTQVTNAGARQLKSALPNTDIRIRP